MRAPNLQLPRLVRRTSAPQLILYVLISFGASVLLTRLFLGLTGFPRLGNSTLHIAHMLYGGLLLAVACFVMLIYASPSSQRVGSVLTGIGLGLFFDEIGKFITTNNDYFYRPAAPIIYLVVVVVAFLYYLLKRGSFHPTDSELVVAALEDAETLLEGIQTEQQHHRIDLNLEYIIDHLKDPDHVQLAQALRAFADSEAVRPGRSRWQVWLTFVDRWLHHQFVHHLRFYTVILILMLVANSIASLLVFIAVAVLPSFVPEIPRWVETVYTGLGLREFSPFHLSVDFADILLSLITTAITLYGIALFGMRRRDAGLFWIQLSLILELCVVNVFAFYAAQFAAAVFALVDLSILLYVRAYQHRLKQLTINQQYQLLAHRDGPPVAGATHLPQSNS
jgi:hypothetical protein